MDSGAMLARLPHGPTALLISEVTEHAPGRIAVLKHWSGEEAWIAAHFPKGPRVVPGVFLAEQVAQAALLLAKLDDVTAADLLYVLGNVRADFLRPALAPCSVLAVVTLTGSARGMIGFAGECSVDGTLLARIRGVASPAPALP